MRSVSLTLEKKTPRARAWGPQDAHRPREAVFEDPTSQIPL